MARRRALERPRASAAGGKDDGRLRRGVGGCVAAAAGDALACAQVYSVYL
jgi:hypothetical protein